MFSGAHAPPLWRGFRFRIACRQQQLRLVRSHTRAGSSPVGHQRKRPFDKRFVASQNPWPS